ncbi:FERD3L [Branchiostoma lanceolatum]|uniref:FERD3L protein n=1 Tax=Branchiostoma lanceolatum TaxID=7740 RepID=A0A8J9ZEG0_BRALA|nr:FERD3L [Branchiostoma lanceolatum]
MPVELRERRAKRSEFDSDDIPVVIPEDKTVEPAKKRRRKTKKTPKKNKKDCAEKKTKKQSEEDEQKVPKPKKKYPYKYRPRPNAAVKERERLVVFNQAFAQLQDKLPERLQLSQEKRMPKKLILQFAVRYIQYLQEELERDPGEPASGEMVMSPEELSLWGTGDEEDKESEVGWQIGGSPIESSASESSMEFIDLSELASTFRAAAGKLGQLAPRAGEGTPGLGAGSDTRPPAIHTRAPGGNTGETNEPSPIYRTDLPNTRLTHMPLCKCTECSTPFLPDDIPAVQPATSPDTSASFTRSDYFDFFPSYIDSIPDIRGELPSLPDYFSPDSPLATVPLSMFDSRGMDRTPPKVSPVYHQPLSPYNIPVTSPSFYDDELHIKMIH